MKELADLVPRVLEKAPACPEPTALRHLRDAAIEFCRRTRIWRHHMTAVVTVTAPEVVVPIVSVQIYEISHAAFRTDPGNITDRGTPLDPVTPEWLDSQHHGWRLEQAPPRYVTQTLPATVLAVPKADGELLLDLILLPAADAEELPDPIIDIYGQFIADGAIGKVLLLPAEWANPDIGAVHLGMFDAHLGRFGNTIPRGQQKSARRVRPSSLF